MIERGHLLALALGLIILITLFGNVLVCLSVIKVRKLRHPSNYLLISLAISDLCVACFVMPFGLYSSINDKWQLGTLLCNVYVVSDVTSCTASILNLCVISIDRYFAITRPLTYCIKRTTKLMLLLIGGVWALACLISVPPLLISGNEYGTMEDPKCEVSQSVWYQLYATIFSFYIPLAVMIFIYYNIYTAAKRVVEAEQRATVMRERKASITLGIIMSAFTICWLPFFIIALVRPFSDTVNNLPRAFVLLTLWLGYANSLLNPIIYVTFHHDFRHAFKHLLCCRCMTINEHIRKDEFKSHYGETQHQENIRKQRQSSQSASFQANTNTNTNAIIANNNANNNNNNSTIITNANTISTTNAIATATTNTTTAKITTNTNTTANTNSNNNNINSFNPQLKQAMSQQQQQQQQHQHHHQLAVRRD